MTEAAEEPGFTPATRIIAHRRQVAAEAMYAVFEAVTPAAPLAKLHVPNDLIGYWDVCRQLRNRSERGAFLKHMLDDAALIRCRMLFVVLHYVVLLRGRPTS